jgi:hypothetical protein
MADYRINSLVLAAGPLSSSPTSATKSARNGLMNGSGYRHCVILVASLSI